MRFMETIPVPRSRNWLLRILGQTRWSLVAKLRREGDSTKQRHADDFCRCYWYPLYSFLRSSGYSAEDAQDHVQSFLVALFRDDLLATADPAKGRLRNFLITLLTRHVAGCLEHSHAQKRGGGAPHVPLDWAAAECAFQQQGRMAGSPEESYRQALAVRLVQDGIAAVRAKYAANGNTALLEEILPALEGPLPEETYATIGARLGMKANAVSVAVVRLRQRFEKEVKAAAFVLLGIPQGPLLDAELRDLFCGPAHHLSV